ncbi:MAG: chorismate synthase [Planctomycetota bacterium]|jgi:chorismate synthase|nr:chorismate synthase [Planctomycetota bacterium]
MGNNQFGRLFTVLTFGESHGPAVGCVVDGCPANVPLGPADIQPMLDRRRPGTGPNVSARKEPDRVEILSGVHEGVTTGHPICLLVVNRDQRPADYDAVKDLFRPGHADAVYQLKYGVRDPRGGGRASARETLGRVAAAGVAKQLLRRLPECGAIRVVAGLTRLGSALARESAWNDDAIAVNPFFCPDPQAVAAMRDGIEDAIAKGDSLGGVVEARAFGVPAGLGEPAHDKLDARIAQACMGINAVKGVEIGDGFGVANATGSENNDALRAPKSGRLADAFLSNHAGGILGGISTGQPIRVRVAVKPTPSISREQETVNARLENASLSVSGRHDPAVAIRAVPVVEAMLWLVLADFALLGRVANAATPGKEPR